MYKIYEWLVKNRTANAVIAIIYFFMVVLPHKAFGTFLNTVVFKGITRDEYNDRVFIGFSVLLLFVLLKFLRNTLDRQDRIKIWVYMVVTTALAYLILKTLFVINIEVVHYPQYALFALLLFPLINHYHSTLIATTLVGAIDEAYQFFYLSPNDTGYYDFNDVITNFIGAAFGLILLKSLGISEQKKSFLKSLGFRILLCSSLLIALLFLTNVLGLTTTSGANFPIILKEIPGFWTTIPPGVTYHVVQPLEGFVILFLLLILYYPIGRLEMNNRIPQSD
jgi:VanZ family protein